MPLHLPHCGLASLVAGTRTQNERQALQIILFSWWRSLTLRWRARGSGQSGRPAVAFPALRTLVGIGASAGRGGTAPLLQ